MSIIREEIAINFQPCPKTNVRCPVAACTFFAEHPYDAELGNLNCATDFALRAVKMHLIQHRVLGDLDVGAGPGHDLGGGRRDWDNLRCRETTLSLLRNRSTQDPNPSRQFYPSR